MKPKSYIIDNKELMSEWDWNANADLDPKTLTPGSNKKAWWKCSKCGGKWYTTICGRTGHDHTGCPYCAGQKVLKGYNDLATKRPEILDQWHPTKNGDISPDSVLPHSKVKVWWVCPKGHEYEQSVVARVLHPSSCPICSGQRVVQGVNDLESRYPDVAKEWNYARNSDVVPTDITWGSNKKFWWRCVKCNHEWQARVSDRTRDHNGCPACGNRKLVSGINDLATKYPEIAKEWHPTKNGDLKPENIKYISKDKVWWVCAKGHEYKQAVNLKTLRGAGCPICSSHRVLAKFNDLATKYPEIAKEWHPTKNGDLKPADVLSKSKQIVWWLCSQGHDYEQAIDKRTTRKQGCPYCSNHKAWQGLNDFETKYPELAKEWHPTKNGDLKPSDVTYGSGKRVWWKCPVSHEYKAVIRDRGIGQTGCSICNKRKASSFPEQAILYYIKKLYPDAVNKYKDIFKNTMELDVYIPELKVAIEYDGANWHKTEDEHKREIKKYKFCKEHQIHLIRIKEKNGVKWADTYDEVYYIKPVKRNNLAELEKIINYVLNSITASIDLLIEDWQISTSPQGTDSVFKYKPFKLFHHGIDVNLERDKLEILNYLSKIENSLSDLRPDVAAKWNYEKNGNLTPDMFTVSSDERVWWKCPDCSHEWQSSIGSMTREGRIGCAICAQKHRGQSFTKGVVARVGSLAETMPELAKEWHPTKNGDLAPYDITSGRFKPAWWKCSKCGYEWLSSPNNRKKGVGCPCCSGRVANIGINDLETIFPDVAKKWNYEKNGDLKPNQFLPGSSKKVWWKCDKCGAEWQRVINSEVEHNLCPFCHDATSQVFMFSSKNNRYK